MEMMHFAISIALLASSFLLVHCEEKMLGPGEWGILNIMKCDEDASMPLKFDITRRKINRMQDGFNAKLDLQEIIDSSYGVFIDISKKVDGGYKPYQVLTDNCFEKFVKKYAKSNVERALAMAKIDPPDFPIPKGVYEINSFVVDYNDMPPEALYGDYIVKAYLLKNGLKRACFNVHVTFLEADDKE